MNPIAHMESDYSLLGGMESLIERTDHSLMEMEFFFNCTKISNKQTIKLAQQLLIILRGMEHEQGY